MSRSPSICRLSLDDLYYKAYLLKQMTTIFVYVCSMLETIAIIWRSATSGFAHYKRDSSYFFFVMEEKGSKNYNNHRHIHINFFFHFGETKINYCFGSTSSLYASYIFFSNPNFVPISCHCMYFCLLAYLCIGQDFVYLFLSCLCFFTFFLPNFFFYYKNCVYVVCSLTDAPEKTKESV